MNTETIIKKVADSYLATIKRTGTKTLNFHPLKGGSGGYSNKVRLSVLQRLTTNGCHLAKNNKERLEIATQAAIDAGYTINDYGEG